MGSEFDIRALIPDADQDEARIRAVYDTINRMVVLIGDLPFSVLFSAPLRIVIRHATPSIERAATAGLLPKPDVLAGLALEVSRDASGLTVSDLFSATRAEIPPTLIEALIKIRRSGVQIPIPAFNDRKSSQRRQALERLVALAPELTFRDLFIRSKQDAGVRVANAVARLRTLGLFSWINNDRCCIHSRTRVSDKCDFQTDKWCNLTGQDGEICSIASQGCEIV
jgi:hypothetical protein